MLKEIVKPAVILFLICAIITGTLAVVNGITKPVIEEREKTELQESLSSVLPGTDEFGAAVNRDELVSAGYKPGERIRNLYKGINRGDLVGYVVEVASRGYGGDISMLVGIDNDLTVVGVKILSHSETPGLGSKADNDEYLKQYLGEIPEALYHVVKKAPAKDGDIEAITSATVTSRAIANGISEAASLVRDYIRGEK